MKNYSFLLLLLIALLPLLFLGCRDDDDGDNFMDAYCRDNPGDPTCPNYAPCFGVLAADSEFEIVDTVSGIFTDTALGIPVTITGGGGNTFFRVNRVNPDATYAWRVGADPRVFTEPFVNLNFTGFNGTVNVSLEVTVPANDSCLFEHELVSRSSKSVTFIQSNINEYPILGTFYGSLSEDDRVLQDTITTTITDWDIMNPNGSHRLRGLPLPADCRFNTPTGLGIPLSLDYGFALSAIRPWYGPNTTDFPRTCQDRNPIFIARITPDDEDEITINYWFNNDEGRRVQRQFVGRRVE